MAYSTNPAPPTDSTLAPVKAADRIFTLDMLRGWAVLGILAVNALTFVWPPALEMSANLAPPWPRDGGNIVGGWVTDVFFQDKFRSLFSMLFGASIFLIGGERFDEARGRLLGRRLFWLAVFGLIHGLAFWYGDILLHYAYCGLIVMVMRSWKAGRLIWIGGGLNLMFGLLSAGALLASAAFGGAGGSPGGGPFDATPEMLAASVQAYQTGWPAAQIQNLTAWALLQSASLTLVPITVGLMLLGMGLFKSGFFQGRSPTWVYLLLLVAGGANLAVFGWYQWIEAHAPHGQDPTEGLAGVAGSFAPLITIGYASLLILMTRFGLKPLTRVLAPVGRMAFTNYLTQTLIMSTLFYMPWGPHWFGSLGPGALWGVVGAVWVAQLIWSPLWLSVFAMGPLEWIWRRLTYGRVAPLLKAQG
jgi:uncharacterized protein